jgi:hypothetical protein
MIAVLMRHQNRIETVEAFAYNRKTLGNLPPAQAGIDQDARPVRRDEGRVSGTAAGENANFNDGPVSSAVYDGSSFFTPSANISGKKCFLSAQ